MKQSRQQNVRGIIHYMRIQGAISSKTRTTFRLASTADFLYSFCSFSLTNNWARSDRYPSFARSIVTIGPRGYTHAHLRIDNAYTAYSIKQKKIKQGMIFYVIDVHTVIWTVTPNKVPWNFLATLGYQR